MKISWRVIPVLLVLAALSGCRGNGPDAPSADGLRGDLLLEIGQPATKASLADGDLFENVLVLLTDEAGTVIDRVIKAYPYTPDPTDPNDIQDANGNSSVNSDVIYFKDLEVGSYNVYAYANYTHTEWQASPTIAEHEATLITEHGAGPGQTAATIGLDRVLTSFSDGTSPQEPAAGSAMLLTGHSRVTVGVSENRGTVELRRPVVRFTVLLRNHTQYPITLTDLHFSHFSASTSYLLDHREANGDPVVPDVAGYNSLPAATANVTVPALSDTFDGEQEVYSQLLFENKAPSIYKLYATVQMTVGEKTMTRQLKSSGAHILPYSVLEAITSDAPRQVMVVNPSSNKGRFLAYNFEAASPYLTSSVAEFNFQQSYLKRAEYLYETTEKEYYLFNLKKTADGFQLWDYSNNCNVFKKVSGGVDCLQIEPGAPTAGSYPVVSEFDGSLARFHKPDGNYFWNNAGSFGYSKSDTGAGNRMWAFYEFNTEGAILKVIDPETSQVSPVTCMNRNEELVVVLNVYFEKSGTEIGFEVENTYWTDGHHSSNHRFK
jgi:hypothetical protein